MTTTIGITTPHGPVLLIAHFSIRLYRMGLPLAPGRRPFPFFAVITAAGPDIAPDNHSRFTTFSLN